MHVMINKPSTAFYLQFVYFEFCVGLVITVAHNSFVQSVNKEKAYGFGMQQIPVWFKIF